MKWALEALGLEVDADARAIKRAYATRLKVTRPDDDPVGFQQLHETYQAALAWSRYRAERAMVDQANDQHEEDTSETVVHNDRSAAPRQIALSPIPDAQYATAQWPESAQPDAAPRPAPAISVDWVVPPQPPLPDVDVEQVQRRILRQAATVDPQELRQWLTAQPELWSLEFKPQIGRTLQRSLLADDHVLIADNYDVLADFFDWEHALDAPDLYLVEQARTRMHRRWLLLPAGHGRLARELQHRGDASASLPQVRKLLGWLAPAESEGAALAAMLWPGRADRIRRLLDLIGYLPDGSKPPAPLDRESALRWYIASERHLFNPVVAVLGLARSAIVGSVFFLLCLLLAMLDHNPAPGMSPVLKVGLYGAAISIVGWSAWYCLTSLGRWQCRPEADPRVKHPWLQRLFIPAIGMLAGALIVAGQQSAATIIALPLLVMALLRWASREGKTFTFRWSWGWIWAAIFLAKAAFVALGALIAYPAVALLATAIAWGADMISQWKFRKIATR
ncbi:hypothetical protein [Xanthomonas sp. 10-10]|uniref:Molecular chaperone DnaJ n=1 Tax=Xanthomonas sp. 10-10 TaxID=3115848 RepID=A0AAU7P7Q4_9XANT